MEGERSEFDFTCEHDYEPYVPEGIYTAEFVDWGRTSWRGIPKIWLKFRLLMASDKRNPEMRVELNMFCDMRNGIPPGSKYAKAWCKAAGRPGSRGIKMHPRIFRNKAYRVRVRTVKPEHGGVELPRDFHYSVVDSIVEVEAL